MLALLCPPCLALDSNNEAKLDVVIVIDKSGSMNHTDSDRLAVEGAKLFIDMMGMNGSRVGIVSFSDYADSFVEITDISGIEDKEKVKSAIDSLEYNGGTDIGIALKTGIEMLESAGAIGNKTTVLFFTDGRIDTSGRSDRTEDQSRRDAQDAIASVAGLFPIYSIGLNADGSVDTGLIDEMAESTGGRSYIVDSPDELPGIFNEIFADFIKSNIISLGSFVTDGINYTEVPVGIPNDSILEANIIILSTDKLADVTITNPEGTSLPIDGKKIILARSNIYYMLKLITPEKGNWTLGIKGPENCKVHINLVYNYNLVLISELAQNEDGTYQARSHFESEGNLIADSGFYNEFKAVATVTAPGGKTAEYTMSVQNGGFEVKLDPKEPGDYTVSIRADSESVYRISDPLKFSIKANSAPEISAGFPGQIDLNGLFLPSLSKKINYSEYVTDADGDVITCSVSNPDEKIAVVSNDAEKKELTVKAGGNGSSSFVLTFSDGNGGFVEKTVQISVNARFMSYIPVIAAILGLIALVVAAIFALNEIKKRRTYFYGKLKYIVSRNNSGSGKEQRYELGYNKGSLRLSSVINSPETAEMALDKIVLYPDVKTNSGIRIVNRSNCEMTFGYGSNTADNATLGEGDSVMITMRSDTSNVAIKLTYSIQG